MQQSEKLRKGETTMSDTKKSIKTQRTILQSKGVEPIVRKTVQPTEVNVVLTPAEVSAIVKKLVDENLVTPVVGDTKNPIGRGPGAVSLISGGCCVDATVSVATTVSTVGINHPAQATEAMKKALTKENIKVNVSLPDNLKIK
jgi:hypothetical protein